ncbi:hypothetical protein [Phytomonospora endophytica]|uniref:Uncharacterized protein n=1 Tax=Phytomonospora endophytica TaxID=714109 RepID=A0A841FP53_9ACTN|nr:hypothetical protein [Phytomonospora endophytica]MBB6037885.1 hypothetical protein [Phytomonospora endophytica]GIG68784.1 hypothetical protein Pen01_50790 [Phytomonospora endophytica]
MGFFGRKSREERNAEIVGKVASGKGFYGGLTRAFLGEADFSKVQQSIAAHNSGAYVQQLLAAGVPTFPATVVSIGDTGKLVNFEPIVDLVLDAPGAVGRIGLQTIISKLQIPRAGDQVLLVGDPSQPGVYLYAGLATAP